MTQDPTTTTSSTPGTQAPAAPPTPVQIFWDVAHLALGLLARIVGVLQPVQAYYPKQAWQVARLLTDIPRLLLTIRFAPERITLTQLRHLTRARHILQTFLGYTLPTSLGARTPSSAKPSVSQHPSSSSNSPSATPPGTRTPASSATPSSPAVPAVGAVSAVREAPGVAPVREVPEVPLVPGLHSRKTPSTAPANSQSPSPNSPYPTLISEQLASSDSHASHNPQSAIRNPQSSFSPYIPDYQTLLQALKAPSLPPNCAGALVEEPGDALIKALRQLHAVYFSLYPNTQSHSPSQSHSHSSGNPQSPSVHPVHPVHSVHPVHPVHSVHLVQSASPSPHSEFHIPHSTTPIRAPD